VVVFPTLVSRPLISQKALALLSKIPLLGKLVLLPRCIKNVCLKRELSFKVLFLSRPFGRIGAGRLFGVLL
jgi:hypothetical protein